MADHRFIGTWEFVTGVFEEASGAIVDPYGSGAKGLVVYDANGHMTVQLMGGERPALGVEDVSEADPDAVVEALASMTTYFGTYAVDPVAATVTHTVEAASHPDWVGRELQRRYEFVGDLLVLSTDPYVAGGRTVTGRLTWRRIA